MHRASNPLPTTHKNGNRLTLNGFEVWISCADDIALTQYNEDYDATKGEATCWIPSEAGQAFSIWTQKRVSDEYGYQTQIFLDGNNIRRLSVLGSRVLVAHKHHQVRVSSEECRTYAFSPVELTDDDNYLHHTLQGIGEIKVIIVKIKPKATAELRVPQGFPLPKPSKIHERSKKGLVHQINYGPAVSSKQDPYMHTFTEKLGTVATFIFRYRPIELLQANGIAPSLADVPRQTESKVEINDGEDAQIPEDILAKERALLAELEQVRMAKRAAVAKDKQQKDRVKSELRHFIPGEIIDLTL